MEGKFDALVDKEIAGGAEIELAAFAASCGLFFTTTMTYLFRVVFLFRGGRKLLIEMPQIQEEWLRAFD